MKSNLFIAVLIFSFFSCDNNEVREINCNSVDFYGLSKYQTLDHSMKIIENTVQLSDSIIVPYSEIILYHRKSHTFIISDYLSDILSDWENHPLARKPFAVVVDGEIIYTGYFWYSFMSSVCDWVIIDPIDYSGENRLSVRLGYPGLIDGDTIPDRRNDPRLLNILRNDGKLIE
jgi:hypothetical protein